MKKYLQHMIDANIPLAGHMGINVKSVDDKGVVLAAPLGPNHNHKGTAFGGSIASLALLCGWSAMVNLFHEWGFKGEAVVASLKTDYILPVDAEFEACCKLPSHTVLRGFKEELTKNGKAKLTLDCNVYIKEKLAANVQGLFVATLFSP